MPIRIRLARHGRKNTPYYHIVAISSGKARDALPLEKLGEYDPIPRVPNISVIPSGAKVFGKGQVHMPTEKKISWNVDRIRHWLGVGAEPSRRVVRLLERGGVLTTPHKYQHMWSPPSADGSMPTQRSEAVRPEMTQDEWRRFRRTGGQWLPGSELGSELGSIPSPAGEMTGFSGKTAT